MAAATSNLDFVCGWGIAAVFPRDFGGFRQKAPPVLHTNRNI
jgi:hypothetical protein